MGSPVFVKKGVTGGCGARANRLFFVVRRRGRSGRIHLREPFLWTKISAVIAGISARLVCCPQNLSRAISQRFLLHRNTHDVGLVARMDRAFARLSRNLARPLTQRHSEVRI
jgi:hypothetical protein